MSGVNPYAPPRDIPDGLGGQVAAVWRRWFSSGLRGLPLIVGVCGLSALLSTGLQALSFEVGSSVVPGQDELPALLLTLLGIHLLQDLLASPLVLLAVLTASAPGALQVPKIALSRVVTVYFVYGLWALFFNVGTIIILPGLLWLIVSVLTINPLKAMEPEAALINTTGMGPRAAGVLPAVLLWFVGVQAISFLQLWALQSGAVALFGVELAAQLVYAGLLLLVCCAWRLHGEQPQPA